MARRDAVLTAATDIAREALADIAPAEQIGDHLTVKAEEDRLHTHRFAAHLTGYRGWEWYVTVARAPRSKKVTVCELGLLPGDDALLSPKWIPWVERMDAEEKAQAREQEAEIAAEKAAEQAEAGQGAAQQS